MSSELTGHIRRNIAAGGPVTFRWFMEQALYHPEHGYYASGKARIGKGGDFYTNVSVGPLFGRLLATQFNDMWERMGRPSPFTIVEQGANDGQFARDVLEALRQFAPDFYEAVRYRLIEPFATLRKTQEDTLGGFGTKISWRGALSELDPFCGIHFSNELLDAMPVHLLVFRGGEWNERLVDWQRDGFVFVEKPIEDELLRSRATEEAGPFREGHLLEVNLDAVAWVGTVASKLTRGYILAIDYGDAKPSAHLRDAGQGTLSCFRAHRRTEDPLAAPGEMDITARVDFTAVASAALGAKLKLEGFTEQHRFMTALAVEGFEKICSEREKTRNILAFNQLSHPDLMGTHFKVLCFSKAVDGGAPPAGFANGSAPAGALGV